MISGSNMVLVCVIVVMTAPSLARGGLMPIMREQLLITESYFDSCQI